MSTHADLMRRPLWPLIACVVVLLVMSGCSPVPPPSLAPNPFERALSELGEQCYMGLLRSAPATAPAAFSRSSPYHVPVQGRQASTSAPKEVLLDRLGQLADIKMARYEEDKSALLLIGPPAADGAGLSADDWRAVFQSLFSRGKALGISIDPGPTPEAMVVRYLGGIENTRLGLTFFEADRMFKSLGGGYDNYSCARFTQRPPTLQTELDLMEAGLRRGERPTQMGWHRLWYEFSEESLKQAENGRTVLIPPQHLQVRVEAIPPGAEYPSSAREFARSLTTRFFELRSHLPVLADLHRQAALVLLGWWVYERGIPIDQHWLETPPQQVATPTTTPAITVTRASLQHRTYVRVGIYGGVDFQRPPTFQTTPEVERFATIAKQWEPQGADIWDFEAEGQRYRAVRLRYERPVVPRVALQTWEQPAITPFAAPEPYILVFPTFDEASRDLSGRAGSCRRTSFENVVVRGDVYVWDKTKNTADKAVELIPEALRVSSQSGQMTVFIIQNRRYTQIGTYTISKQPAYRENMEVLVMYWPQMTCAGRISLQADPPSLRIVQPEPGYGSVVLAEHIAKLRKEK